MTDSALRTAVEPRPRWTLRCTGPFLHRFSKWEEIGTIQGKLRSLADPMNEWVEQVPQIVQHRHCADCGRLEARRVKQ